MSKKNKRSRTPWSTVHIAFEESLPESEPIVRAFSPARVEFVDPEHRFIRVSERRTFKYADENEIHSAVVQRIFPSHSVMEMTIVPIELAAVLTSIATEREAEDDDHVLTEEDLLDELEERKEDLVDELVSHMVEEIDDDEAE